MKYNDFLDLLMTRHSCRSFLDKDVPDEIVSEIMLAGRCAPSSHNSQANIIIRLKDKHLRNCLEANLRKMMQMPDSFHPFYDAPEVIAVLNFGDDASLRLLDGACVMQNMLLAVTSLGLGACWINGLQHEHMCNDSVVLKLREKLDIENAFGVGCIAIGHPDSDSTIIKLTGNSVYEV